MFNKQNRLIRIGIRITFILAGSFSLLFLIPIQSQAAIIHPVNELLFLTNQERLTNNLQPLILNSNLTAAAQAKAQHMIDNNYFNHQSPDGRQPWDFIAKTGYRYVYAGENLAINFADARQNFTAWLNSSSHRENILFPDFQETGLATRSAEINGQMVTLTVQMFGSRSDFMPLGTYLLDLAQSPKKNESLIDKQMTDLTGTTGYVASSASINTTAKPGDNQSAPLTSLWLLLGFYLAILVGLLHLLTKKGLFLHYLRKLTLFLWLLIVCFFLI